MHRAAFAVEGVIRNREEGSGGLRVAVRAGGRPTAAGAAIVGIPLESEIADFRACNDVAARTAVEPVNAYDRVLENIRLAPLSLPETHRLRDPLTPVADQLRKYRAQ